MEPQATLYETLTLFIPKIDGFQDKFDAALSYIHSIRIQFSNDPEKYSSFRTALERITAKRICDDGDIVTLLKTPESDFDEIRAILQGGDGLIAGFDTYVPLKYQGDHSKIGTIDFLSNFSDSDSDNDSDNAREVQGKKRKRIFEELTLWENDFDKEKKKIRAVAESYLTKLRGSVGDSNHLNLLRGLYFYGEGRMEKYQLEQMVAEMAGTYPGVPQELEQVLKQCQNIATRQLEERERITSSYFDSEICPSSELEESVLNHGYTCRQPTLEDWKRETGNTIEDDKLEVDLSVEWFKSAIMHANFLMGIEQDLDWDERNKTMSKIHFNRCLELIDDGYNTIVDLYKEEPETALPIILCKFQEMLEERLHREAYEKHWSSKKENDS